MWLDNLKELKKAQNISSKTIAEKANLPERTVTRLFAGETPSPYADTLYRIAIVLGASLDDILADSKAVIGTTSIATLNAENEQLVKDLCAAQEELSSVKAELATVKEQNVKLVNDNDKLHLQLTHKDELLALIEHFIKKGDL